MLRNPTLRLLLPNPKLKKKNDSSHDTSGKLNGNIYNFCLRGKREQKDSGRQDISFWYMFLRFSTDEVGSILQLMKDVCE